MDQHEIQGKANELNDLLSRYGHDLGTLEKELSAAIQRYHEALKEEKLKEIKESMTGQ
jgi:hypothetical protein